MSFKPMLAKEYDPAKLIFPCYASPKLDGIRASVVGGKLLSRSLKPIPNKHVYNLLSDKRFEGFDGELIVGDVTALNVFSNTTSHVMSHDKVFDFTYFVFDLHDCEMGFDVRYARLCRREHHGVNIVLLPQTRIHNEAGLAEYEAAQVEAGYEGVILRKIDGLYKYGRSTVNEGYLLKVKRFTDGEATIIGFEEQMKNDNEKTVNELGRSKRSSHQENKHGKGTLGALIVRDLVTDVAFNIGTGLDDAIRADIWAKREEHHGLVVKYKSFEVGVKDKPRHPVFLGFRDGRDMS
ncbi:ATP-dependent DNA ligase [Herminiimonas sp. CN]|uniref:ATP-dependent DNA ligase n=1 Tax=Herminiimonas sp. CN TaxID=1349818 RepID=UPI0004733A4A|nr:ATP-dependent DNA ligase [Herminiimonas sp. CN]